MNFFKGSTAQARDNSHHRLLLGLLFSLVLHALLLTMQFGIPGLGLPSMEMPWTKRMAEEAPLTVALQPAPAATPAILPPPLATPPSPELTESEHESTTHTPPESKPTTGFTLVDPRPTPPPPSPATPLQTAIPTPKPAPPAPPATRKPRAQERKATPVIAKDQTTPDSFFVSATDSEDIAKEEIKAEAKIEAIPDALDTEKEDAKLQALAAKKLEEQKQADALAQAAKLEAEKKAEQAAKLAQAEEKAKAEKAEKETLAAAQALKQAQAQKEAIAAVQRQERERIEAEKLAAQTAAQQLAQKQAEQEKLQKEATLKRQQEEFAEKAKEEAKRLLAAKQEEARKIALQEELERKRKDEADKLQAQRQLEKEQAIAQEKARELAREQARLQAENEARNAAQAKAQAEAQAKAEAKARADALAKAQAEANAKAQALADAARNANSNNSGNNPTAANSGTGNTNNFVLPKNLAGSPLADIAKAQLKGLDLSRPASAVTQNDDAKLGRRSVFGSLNQEVPVRMYVEAWQQKIERNGRLNYAQSAVNNARGDPIVSVTIRSDGSVDDITILRTSGNRELDEAVRRIIRVNAPYGPFPKNVAARYDMIEIRRIWSFDETLKLVEEIR